MSQKRKNASARPTEETAVTEEEEARSTRETVNQLMSVYLLVVSIISGAWFLGTYAFSFLWVFMLTAVLFFVWKSKLTRLITKHLEREETNIHRKRALKQSETTEWLNFLINRWWVFSSSTIEDLVKKRIDDRLVTVKPSFLDHIELTAFTFGGQTPSIRHVHVFEYSDGVGGSKPVTWVSIDKPPRGLDKMSSFEVVLEADISTQCEDFRMVFSSRVGSKRIGLSFDTIVEDLNINGRIQILLKYSMDVPFPHVAKATFSFVSLAKCMPDVWFNVRVLKALQIMEVPLVKSWVHTHVMEGLTKALVDPGKIDLKLGSLGPVQAKGLIPSKKTQQAQGVLTIQVKGSAVKDAGCEDIRYTVLRIGDNKRQARDVYAQQEWDDVCSFFIYNMTKEKLEIKSKCRRLLTSVTLETHQLDLSSFPLGLQKVVEKTVVNKDGSKLSLVMTYTPLPAISLDVQLPASPPPITEVAGVLYVCVHGATNVLASDWGGTSDPYCILFCDRRRIMTTQYVLRTRSPRWEAGVEFFVSDFSKVKIMKHDEPMLIKESLTLGYNRPAEGYVCDKAYGQVIVSAIFRPVSSVLKSERQRLTSVDGLGNGYLYMEDRVSPASVGPGRMVRGSFIDEYLEGKNYVELTLLQAKDLVAMDRNGFSDPYCEVMVKEKMLFRTTVRKKTLFPKWNESVTFELPTDVQSVDVMMYDKDVLSDDFLGKVTLDLDKMKELSIKGTADWFPLQRTKSGELQLRCCVTSKETVLRSDQYKAMLSVLDKQKKTAKKTAVPSRLDEEGEEVFATEATKAQTPQKEVFDPSKKQNSFDQNNSSGPILRKSTSDVDVSRKRGSQTYTSNNGPTLRAAESVNSFHAFHKGYDSVSTVSSPSEKYYSVAGKIHAIKGLKANDGSVYCKVRFDPPSHRLRFFIHSRVIAKSPMVTVTSPGLNLGFEVDRGQGANTASVIIFDVKRDNKEHLATRGYTLRALFDETDGFMERWLPLENGLEIELTLSQGQPDPRLIHKKQGRFQKSWSFRKVKNS
ncbi:hypothetical protein ScPMuIL_014340 [Solemya velum]